MEVGSFVSLLVLLLTLSAMVIKKFKSQRQAKRSQPPGPRNIPFIGCIHRLLTQEPIYKILNRLSSTYGPIMRLKLGEINVVVISTADGAREVLRTHDLAFASRPIRSTVRIIGYGDKELVFAPYGEYWRQMRRLCATELFSAKRVRCFRRIREEEVASMVRCLADASDAVDLTEMLTRVVNNITARAVVGGKIANLKLFLSVLAETVELLAGFTVADIFPSIPFLPRLTGVHRKLEQCHQKIDDMSEEIIREHKRMRDSVCTDEDLTDVLLKIQRDGNLQFPLTNEHIKAVIIDLLMAGTETTSTGIEWAMSELIRNPTIMKKVQKEVREVFEGNKMTQIIVEEELMNSENLSYLKSVIKETLRLHPPLPLVPPRQNQERCEVMGYEIPAKTTVLINAWTIGRDPKYWKDPNVFWPERFMGNDIDFRGSNFEFIPFGAGRRICPGMQFGLITLEMILVHILYYFDWEYPTKEIEKGQLDMTEATGFTLKRKSPLCLLPIPRIPLPIKLIEA